MSFGLWDMGGGLCVAGRKVGGDGLRVLGYGYLTE
jgi:hypothetical protein